MPGAALPVVAAVERTLRQEPLAAGERVLVAFSGGADSTALLLATQAAAPALGVEVLAAHLDHGLTADSRQRAAAAAALAQRLGVRCLGARRPVSTHNTRDGIEARARSARYHFLEQARRRTGARVILTAHHQDDQVETVLLRLLRGSGWQGLAGIRARHHFVRRPLLELTRRQLRSALADSEVCPLEDPSNHELRFQRNALRHLLWPALVRREPEIAAVAARLAASAQRARAALDRTFERWLHPRSAAGQVTVAWSRFALLPEAFHGAALSYLNRLAGAPYPGTSGARAELLRQLGRGQGIGCDCGHGVRWQRRGDWLVVRNNQGRPQGFHVYSEGSAEGDDSLPRSPFEACAETAPATARAARTPAVRTTTEVQSS